MRYESSYGAVYARNELWHHGIKGQEWGVRRFQNEDGTLTAAGKDRYLKGEAYSKEKKVLAEQHEEKLLDKKSNAHVKQVKNKLNELKKKFDLDDDGKATDDTDRDYYTPEEIQKAENEYKTMSQFIKDDYDEIRKQADAKATQDLIKKYGSESISDIEYYQKKKGAKTAAIVAGIFAAFAAIPIIGILSAKAKANKVTQYETGYDAMKRRAGWK